MTPTIHVITGAKGGVGTTTITAALALITARNTGQRVLAVDAAARHDLRVVFGRPAGEPGTTAITALVDVADTDPTNLANLADDRAYGHVFVDAGTDRLDPELPVQRSLVVRNDYLALRAAGAHPSPDQVIAVCEKSRALTSTDIAAVLGGPLITITASPDVARAVDAGLLVSRIPFELDVALRHAHRHHRPDLAA